MVLSHLYEESLYMMDLVLQNNEGRTHYLRVITEDSLGEMDMKPIRFPSSGPQ